MSSMILLEGECDSYYTPLKAFFDNKSVIIKSTGASSVVKRANSTQTIRFVGVANSGGMQMIISKSLQCKS